jgi:hypothetical protein
MKNAQDLQTKLLIEVSEETVCKAQLHMMKLDKMLTQTNEI